MRRCRRWRKHSEKSLRAGEKRARSEYPENCMDRGGRGGGAVVFGGGVVDFGGGVGTSRAGKVPGRDSCRRAAAAVGRAREEPRPCS